MSNPVNDDDRDRMERLSPAARELEGALSQLRPAHPGSVNEAGVANRAGIAYRDQVMFRAGEAAGEQKERAAGRRQLWAWRGAAAVLAAATFAYAARIVAQPAHPAVVVYVHDAVPSTQGRVAVPATRETKELPLERQYGQAGRGADDAAPATPATGWLGVRGEYLSTRAAVLRWGVAALPRVDESLAERSAPTPLDEVNKLFWKKSDGGRL
jgi:hypothetical protein